MERPRPYLISNPNPSPTAHSITMIQKMHLNSAERMIGSPTCNLPTQEFLSFWIDMQINLPNDCGDVEADPRMVRLPWISFGSSWPPPWLSGQSCFSASRGVVHEDTWHDKLSVNVSIFTTVAGKEWQSCETCTIESRMSCDVMRWRLCTQYILIRLR